MEEPMKKMVTAVMVAAAVLGSVYALGDKKSKQTVITVLDYQDAFAVARFPVPPQAKHTRPV